jgi:hypothetical protein
MTKPPFDKLDPELLEVMECERQVEDNLARIRICARAAAEASEKLLHCAASEKLRAGFVPFQVAALLRAVADRIEANGIGDPPTEWDATPWDRAEEV